MNNVAGSPDHGSDVVGKPDDCQETKMRGGRDDCSASNDMSAKIRNMSILSAFLVVVIHCRPAFAGGTLGWWCKQFLEGGVTHIAVPFFFVISGYFLSSHYAACETASFASVWKNEVRKRVRTLLFPFFVWNLCYWVFLLSGVVIQNLVRHLPISFWFPSFEQLGFSASTCPLLSPLWYVRALFMMALLSPVFWKGLGKFGMLFLVFLFVLYGGICPFTGLPESWPLHSYSRTGLFPVLGFFYFTFGMAIRNGMIHDVRLNPWCSLFLGMMLVAIRAIMVKMGIPCEYFAGFFSVPFLLYGVWRLIPTTPWPVWLTSYPFSIYLIHKFILNIIVKVVDPGAGVFLYLGVAVATFFVSLAIAVAMHRLCPRLSKIVFGGR